MLPFAELLTCQLFFSLSYRVAILLFGLSILFNKSDFSLVLTGSLYFLLLFSDFLSYRLLFLQSLLDKVSVPTATASPLLSSLARKFPAV